MQRSASAPAPASEVRVRVASHRRTPAHARNYQVEDRETAAHRIEQSTSHRGTNWVGHRQFVFLETPLFSPSHQATWPPSFASQPSIHLPFHPAPSRIESSRVESRRHIVSAKPLGAKHPISKQPADVGPQTAHCSCLSALRAPQFVVFHLSSSLPSKSFPPDCLSRPTARNLQRTHARGCRVSELSGTPAFHLLLLCMVYKLDLSLLLTMDEISQPAHV